MSNTLARGSVVSGLATLALLGGLTTTATAADTGSLAVTATDATTGVPLQTFCAMALGRPGGVRACTDSGQVLFTDLQPGDWTAETIGDDFHRYGRSPAVTVVAGQTATADIKLPPAGVISAITVDASTHAPVANACVDAVTADETVQFGYGCTDATGRLRLPSLLAGTYQLFVLPRDSAHGSQWVGASGGTGRRTEAVRFEVHDGQVTDVPQILLDGAGTITGTITDKVTGAPIQGICTATHAGTGYNPQTCTDTNGRYTITNVGPYDWAVHFSKYDDGTYAWQWSGGAPTEGTARRFQIHSGQTTVVDQRLIKGATVTGQVSQPDGFPANARVQAFNAHTGEAVGIETYAYPGSNGVYEVRGLLGPQLVKVRVQPDSGPPVWYPNAATFADARPVFVRPSSTVTGINVVVP